jgi:hypothetical protein
MKRFTQFLLREGWTKMPNGAYTIEASEMQDNENKDCPHCGVRLDGHIGLSAIKDKEGETTHWQGTHPCGANITILND